MKFIRPTAFGVTVAFLMPALSAQVRSTASLAKIRRAAADADARSVGAQRLSLRSKPKRSADMVEIFMGETAEDLNPYTGRVMLRRLDVRKPERMWEFATFEPTESERVPAAYLVPPEQTRAVERLRTHGVRLERIEQPMRLQREAFQIESTETTAQPFENHRERTVTGRYSTVEQTVPVGRWRVPMSQPLARLAFCLLEPRSNDGLLTWNVLDEALKEAKVYPILRTRD